MLVVSEVCAGGYGVGRVRVRSASGAERVVDGSAVRAPWASRKKNNVSRQTLFLVVAELGFRLHLSQWDRDFRAKIIFVAVHRHQIKPATYESAVRSQLPLGAAGLRDSPPSQSLSTSQPTPDSRSGIGIPRHPSSPEILH